jgi:hypothetical protein
MLDLATPSGRAMAGLLSVFAEFEHEILRERIRAGIAEASLKGKRFGRPLTAAKKAGQIRKLSRAGVTGRTCFAGIDMAWTTDMAALALLFSPLGNSGQWKELFSSGCRASGYPISSGARGLRLRVGRAPGSWNQLRAPRSI